MLSLLVYMLGMAGTLYIAAIYSSEGFILLFIIELVYILADILLLSWQRRQVQVHLEFPMPSAEKGQEVPIELAVNNRSRIPVAKETVCLKYTSSGSRRVEKLKFTVFAGAKRSVRFSNRIAGIHSGSYYFEKAVVTLYDPLKLLRVRKRIFLHERLDIMPEIYSTGILVSEAARHFMGESDIYDSLSGGDDASETFQIREFRAGDKLKDIHWKLSAKEEEWIVRESGKPLACPVILLISLASNGKKRNTGNRDALLSLAASISYTLLEHKCPHYAAWFRKTEQDIVRVRVDSEENLYLFLMSIMGEAAVTEKIDLKEAYQERYKGEAFLTDICVNDQLQVIVRGEVAGSCDSGQMEKSLGEMLLHV